jgi:hypothetical protein
LTARLWLHADLGRLAARQTRSGLSTRLALLAGADRAPAGRGDASSAGGRDELEVVVRDRILVFLSQEALLDEDLEVRRKGIGVLPLEQSNRPRILVTAPDEFFLPLSLRKVGPDGQGSTHEHGHDAQTDQERGHCVAAVTLT